jgi:hypothetical protein
MSFYQITRVMMVVCMLLFSGIAYPEENPSPSSLAEAQYIFGSIRTDRSKMKSGHYQMEKTTKKYSNHATIFFRDEMFHVTGTKVDLRNNTSTQYFLSYDRQKMKYWASNIETLGYYNIDSFTIWDDYDYQDIRCHLLLTDSNQDPRYRYDYSFFLGKLQEATISSTLSVKKNTEFLHLTSSRDLPGSAKSIFDYQFSLNNLALPIRHSSCIESIDGTKTFFFERFATWGTMLDVSIPLTLSQPVSTKYYDPFDCKYTWTAVNHDPSIEVFQSIPDIVPDDCAIVDYTTKPPTVLRARKSTPFSVPGSEMVQQRRKYLIILAPLLILVLMFVYRKAQARKAK